MRRMVDGRELRCELDGEQTHDRCVAVCYLEGEDISEILVRRGLARDCPRFSGGRYAEAEREAADDGATIGRVYFGMARCLARWTAPAATARSFVRMATSRSAAQPRVVFMIPTAT